GITIPFTTARRLKIKITAIRKLFPERTIRERTKGQSVSKTQIVYRTKSDLNVVVMPRRYTIFVIRRIGNHIEVYQNDRHPFISVDRHAPFRSRTTLTFK